MSWAIDHVWFWTRDMERAVIFYRDVVGLSPRSRYGDEWAEFEAGTVRLALHGAGEGRDLPHGGTAVFRVPEGLPDDVAVLASNEGAGE